MLLWRISNYADLSGAGGLRHSARWHTKGRPIVYTAEHPAGALSEFLVHLDWADIPKMFQLVTVDVDDSVTAEHIEPRRLPKGWTAEIGISRTIGDEWLARCSSLLLRVPSVLVPGAFNMLINPSHPDAHKMRIAKSEKVPLDRRLARR